MDMGEYAEKNIYPYIWHEKKDSADYWINLFLSDGPSGSSVELEFEYEGKTETVVLTRTKGDIDWFYPDSTPKPDENLREVYNSDSHRIAMTEDNIAIITIDTMSNNNLPNEFYANFPLPEKARGYIIDVRYNGGGFQICTMHCTYPDGREFINIGVKPHIPCEMTLNDYKNGVDSVLNKGLEVIRGMTEE